MILYLIVMITFGIFAVLMLAYIFFKPIYDDVIIKSETETLEIRKIYCNNSLTYYYFFTIDKTGKVTQHTGEINRNIDGIFFDLPPDAKRLVKIKTEIARNGRRYHTYEIHLNSEDDIIINNQ